MEELIQDLTKIIIITIVVLAVIGLIVGFIVIKFLKGKQHPLTEANIDYSNFERKDAKDYIKIEDIFDDMIVLDNGCRYVGAITCQGYNFYDSHTVEQLNTVENYIGFIGIINKPISFRQHSSSDDAELRLGKYYESLNDVTNNLDELLLRQYELSNKSLEIGDLDDYKKDYIEKELAKLSRLIKAFEFRKFHIEDQIRFIMNNSGEKANPIITSCYAFDWVYDPVLIGADIPDDEIIERAKQELNIRANAMIRSLSNSGVRAKRCKTEELIDMCRRHSQPISAERYKLRDVLDSSYFDEFITGDVLDEFRNQAREEMLSNSAMKSYSDLENINSLLETS